MNSDCLYAAEPEDWTRVVTVLGKAANYHTNDALSFNLQAKGESANYYA